MIYTASVRLTNELERKGYIEEAEHDSIAYGLFIILSRVFYALICIGIGCAFRCVLESLVFYFSFLFLRRYAGGIHAETELHCIVASSISILCALIYIHISNIFSSAVIVDILLSIVCSVLIIMFSPVDSNEKPLATEEKKRYRQKTIIRIAILILMMFIMYFASKISIFTSISTALTLECILLIAGRIKNQFAKYKSTSA